MIEVFSFIFILVVSFIFVSPFLIFFIKVSNRIPQSGYMGSFRPIKTVEPNLISTKKTKKKKAINTSSSISHPNPAIKEFTMPDGSKIAIDLDKVELEEKQVFQ